MKIALIIESPALGDTQIHSPIIVDDEDRDEAVEQEFIIALIHDVVSKAKRMYDIPDHLLDLS